VALRSEGSTVLSYEELAARAERLARRLLAAGIERGEPVGLLAPSGPRWITTCLAIIRAGAAVTPIDAQLEDEGLESRGGSRPGSA